MHKPNFYADLREYDVVLTTSLNSNHHISGHLYELIEYFYYLKFYHNVDVCILIPFELTLNEYKIALTSKYDFTESELEIYLSCTKLIEYPKILLGKTIIFTDGMCYDIKIFKGMIKANKIISIRCKDTYTLDKANVVLQDNRLYPDLKNSVHYIKKVLVSKLKPITNSPANVAMLYGTTNCREVTMEIMEQLVEKYDFEKFIILTNKEYDVPDKFEIKLVPVENIFSLFGTYIYTPINLKNTCSNFDCSPRFPVECTYYNKQVIYELDSMDLGLRVRQYDIENHFERLILDKSDTLVNYI